MVELNRGRHATSTKMNVLFSLLLLLATLAVSQVRSHTHTSTHRLHSQPRIFAPHRRALATQALVLAGGTGHAVRVARSAVAVTRSLRMVAYACGCAACAGGNSHHCACDCDVCKPPTAACAPGCTGGACCERRAPTTRARLIDPGCPPGCSGCSGCGGH